MLFSLNSLSFFLFHPPLANLFFCTQIIFYGCSDFSLLHSFSVTFKLLSLSEVLSTLLLHFIPYMYLAFLLRAFCFKHCLLAPSFHISLFVDFFVSLSFATMRYLSFSRFFFNYSTFPFPFSFDAFGSILLSDFLAISSFFVFPPANPSHRFPSFSSLFLFQCAATPVFLFT